MQKLDLPDRRFDSLCFVCLRLHISRYLPASTNTHTIKLDFISTLLLLVLFFASFIFALRPSITKSTSVRHDSFSSNVCYSFMPLALILVQDPIVEPLPRCSVLWWISYTRNWSLSWNTGFNVQSVSILIKMLIGGSLNYCRIMIYGVKCALSSSKMFR